jgi:hypothetical protein
LGFQCARNLADLKGWNNEVLFQRAKSKLMLPALDAVENEIRSKLNPEGKLFDLETLEKFLHSNFGV